MHKFADRTFANLIFINLEMNGIEFIALFDTGAEISVISKSVAKKLNLHREKSLTGGNNNGYKFSVESGVVNKIAVGGFSVKNVQVGIIPDSFFNFGTDEKGNNFPAEIFLGWDFISQFYWKIETKERKFIIKDGGSAPLSETLDWDGFPIIKALYNGTPIDIGFDSGHTDSMLDKSWLSKLDGIVWVEEKITGVGSSKTEKVATFENFVLQIGRTNVVLPLIEILPRTIHGAKEGTVSGLLGADLIENRVFELDYKSCFFKMENNL